ncbi:hypothetical protein GCM10011289_36200 [Paludibacterium paludis]|uniref:Uncharacterized protein n=1 Tax=Paludibacterium paludis TaxID=1225769 RepID=A0A918P780_9NEIS|nr:hypothetical protein GCM10011289_36200 [Paludibacterium paludis]
MLRHASFGTGDRRREDILPTEPTVSDNVKLTHLDKPKLTHLG